MVELLAAAGAVLLVDQWTKQIVHVHVAGRHLSLGPVVRIRQVATVRASYLRSRGRSTHVLVWAVALVSATVLHRIGPGFQEPVATVGLGAAIGGAAGNLLDIVRRHAVRDFIDFGWWPVFNLADVGIVLGLSLAFWPVG